MPHSRIIYLGIKGSVIAVDAFTGAQLWTVHLTGASFVNVVLDDDNLYATTNGEIFCLDPRTGEGRWHNQLKGFGWGLVSIAGEGIGNSQAFLQAEEHNRQQQRQSSTASPGAAAGG